MATKQKTIGVKITTPVGRVSYPALLVPKFKYQSKTDKEYSVELLFEKGADLSAFKKACKEALLEVFGSEAKFPKNIQLPIRDQQELIDSLQEKDKDHSHLTPGAMFARFKTNAANGAPIVVGANMETIMDEKEIYGGCYGRANVTLKVVTIPSTKITYVTGYLSGFQKTKDGKAFGSKPDAAQMFESVKDDEESADSDSLFG